MRQIPEKDWKKIRKLKDQLLQKFCDRALDKLKSVIDSRDQGSHKAYLELWKVLNVEDDELALMFNDLKRSTAFYKLAAWKKSSLLSEEDFSQFSNETQNVINLLLGAH